MHFCLRLLLCSDFFLVPTAVDDVADGGDDEDKDQSVKQSADDAHPSQLHPAGVHGVKLLDDGQTRIEKAERVVKQHEGKLDCQVADGHHRQIGRSRFEREQGSEGAFVQELQKRAAALAVTRQLKTRNQRVDQRSDHGEYNQNRPFQSGFVVNFRVDHALGKQEEQDQRNAVIQDVLEGKPKNSFDQESFFSAAEKLLFARLILTGVFVPTVHVFHACSSFREENLYIVNLCIYYTLKKRNCQWENQSFLEIIISCFGRFVNRTGG